MKTVTFTWPHPTGGYGCNKPGDQSGEYVESEIADDLLDAIKAIYECGSIRDAERIACRAIEKYDEKFFDKESL